MNRLLKLNRFEFGFKVVGVWAMAAILGACGGTEDIRKSISMEYLDAKTGKPIVYPVGVDAPEVSDAFAIPPLPQGNRANNADINKLVRPPSLLPAERRSPASRDDAGDESATASSSSETGVE